MDAESPLQLLQLGRAELERIGTGQAVADAACAGSRCGGTLGPGPQRWLGHRQQQGCRQGDTDRAEGPQPARQACCCTLPLRLSSSAGVWIAGGCVDHGSTGVVGNGRGGANHGSSYSTAITDA
jgi:hypothetical protein